MADRPSSGGRPCHGGCCCCRPAPKPRRPHCPHCPHTRAHAHPPPPPHPHPLTPPAHRSSAPGTARCCRRRPAPAAPSRGPSARLRGGGGRRGRAGVRMDGGTRGRAIRRMNPTGGTACLPASLPSRASSLPPGAPPARTHTSTTSHPQTTALGHSPQPGPRPARPPTHHHHAACHPPAAPSSCRRRHSARHWSSSALSADTDALSSTSTARLRRSSPAWGERRGRGGARAGVSAGAGAAGRGQLLAHHQTLHTHTHTHTPPPPPHPPPPTHLPSSARNAGARTHSRTPRTPAPAGAARQDAASPLSAPLSVRSTHRRK